jgi:hypothetical protein
MSDPINYHTFCKLLKLRILLAGDGAFRLQPNVAGGYFGALFIMPGPGYVIPVWTESDGAVMAKIVFPDGIQLSKAMEIANSGNFANLLHNIDVVTWQEWKGLPASGSPVEIIDVVNG